MFSVFAMVSNGFDRLVRVLMVRLSYIRGLAPRINSGLNYINAWVPIILLVSLVAWIVELLIRLALFFFILSAILFSIISIWFLSLSSIDLTLVELGSGCCSIHIFQDELASETVILFWNIVLVECVEIWEMVFTLLGTMQVVVQTHDCLDERLIVDWYTKYCCFESELI